MYYKNSLKTKHTESHPMSGDVVTLKNPINSVMNQQSHIFAVIDWADRVRAADYGEKYTSLKNSYIAKLVIEGIPLDNKGVFGKADGSPLIIHNSEILDRL